jgi:hypothetical protein
MTLENANAGDGDSGTRQVNSSRQEESASNRQTHNAGQIIRPCRAKACQTCGQPIIAARTGRRRRFCSERCRDAHRRQLNFEFFGRTVNWQGKTRNAKKPVEQLKNGGCYSCGPKPRNSNTSAVISNNCEAIFSCRGSAINGLAPRNILGGHRWEFAAPVDRKILGKIVRAEIGAAATTPSQADGAV